MTGKITHFATAASEHDRVGCAGKPDANLYIPGTVWTCDDCSQQWVVVHGSQYNEPYKAWRLLTDANRDGRDR